MVIRLLIILTITINTMAVVSSWPVLDSAAKALAEGKLDAASEEFETISQDTSAPAFVRGLALLGQADVSLAKQNVAQAKTIWQHTADDVTLLKFHRDTARRRILELPERDPAAYRIQLPELPEPAVVLHVASTGNDSADGSAQKSFRTLERARDAIRNLKKTHGGTLPKGGVKIILDGGFYPIRQTFHLTSEDSGTVESPIIYQAKPGRKPIFSGGVLIKEWKPISNPQLRDKLDPSVRDKVLEANLKTAGIINWGEATQLRHRPELFANGQPQTLARWPNEGFVKTGEILGEDRFKVWNRIDGCRDGKFHYLGDRPSRWVDEPDVHLYGYWFWDWYEQYQKVASIDADARIFTLSPPYSNYGYRKDQRYYVVNVFRELDCPGEWYLDRRTGMIYWLPPEGPRGETVLSVFDEPFIVLNDVEHVTLLGLTLQEGRSDGIHIRDGAGCLVAGCTIRRFGGDAIIVQGGQQHSIFGCIMNTLGCGGADVFGGDHQTLTSGHHVVENCIVSDISRIKRTYTPAVHLNGCGNRIAHNLFEKIPSSAMRIDGNEHLIELNVIRDVVQESDDQGGLDMWGNPLYRGVVIRWNRWSDIRGGTHTGAAGIRLDDMISGVAVYGNIFERCGTVKFGGVQIHGGKENIIDGNLFTDCFAGISFSRWGQKRWLESIERFVQQAGQPPYSNRYPELARLKDNEDVNFISRNLFSNCESVFLRDGGIQQGALNTTTNRFITPERVSKGMFSDDELHLREILFEKIPLEEMGPYSHPWRAQE
ncbi:MAG: right-handed parallel beta-helix repeat-containing protein [Sedimentisphaerales bacterium]|nr:right-handed parallel beta-helix repeat-containing protein [Sedimentisphaerales bacterium]